MKLGNFSRRGEEVANKGKTNIYLIKTSLRHERSLTLVVRVVLEEAVASSGHDVM